jgi:alpha-methylacyl-CoA racemase
VTTEATGPLAGVRVIELAGIGPGPFCAMVLSDMGADVIRVDRAAHVAGADPSRARNEVLNRGRRSVAVDLKQPDGVETLLRLAAGSDALIEVWRPGVAERLGIGPDVCLARNPRLVYGRMTGWGQEGPMAAKAGHDIDYIGLAGALHAIGRAGQPPSPPMTLIGDFGGGGFLLAYGIVCALFEASGSGKGQVVDAAMVDGAAMLLAPFFAAADLGFWSDERGTNLLDSGAPFYDAYECGDGRWIAVGALEPQFYADLLEGLGLAGDASLPDQNDRTRWPELRARFTQLFRSRTRDEWVDAFADLDACVGPVLSLRDTATHPHLVARGTFVAVNGVRNPAPAPRFSRTPGGLRHPPPFAGEHTDDVLLEAGFDPGEVAALRAAGAVR